MTAAELFFRHADTDNIAAHFEDRSFTYRELAAKVSVAIPAHQRNPSFHAALGEVTTACRAAGLPCLPAIVWLGGRRRPSTGYYSVAHPRARTGSARASAWEREHAEVVRDATKFPGRL